MLALELLKNCAEHFWKACQGGDSAHPIIITNCILGEKQGTWIHICSLRGTVSVIHSLSTFSVCTSCIIPCEIAVVTLTWVSSGCDFLCLDWPWSLSQTALFALNRLLNEGMNNPFLKAHFPTTPQRQAVQELWPWGSTKEEGGRGRDRDLISRLSTSS